MAYNPTMLPGMAEDHDANWSKELVCTALKPVERHSTLLDRFAAAANLSDAGGSSESSTSESMNPLAHSELCLQRENADLGGIDWRGVYAGLRDNSVNVKKRLELFALLKKQLQSGAVSLQRLAPYHLHFCIEQLQAFNLRQTIGPLEGSELLLAPTLQLTLEALLMTNSGNFTNTALRSQLLHELAKLVLTFAERMDVVTRSLSKVCDLKLALGYTKTVSAQYDFMKAVLELDGVPNEVLLSTRCLQGELQHLGDCSCHDCSKNRTGDPCESLRLLLLSGREGHEVYPIRSLPQHRAALASKPMFLRWLYERSEQMVQLEKERAEGPPGPRWARELNIRMLKPGQALALKTDKGPEWLSFEPLVSCSLSLPSWLRAQVLCCSPLRHHDPPLVALWLPDVAATALASPSRLLELSDALTALPPLVDLVKAGPAVPLHVLQISLEMILKLLSVGGLPSAVCSVLLPDLKSLRCVQLLRYLSGELRVLFLRVLLCVSPEDERASRHFVSCMLHNTLADWLLWKGHTEGVPPEELKAALDGLLQTMQRIDVHKWPRQPLLLKLVQAMLMERNLDQQIFTRLTACRKMLEPGVRGWAANQRGAQGGRWGVGRGMEQQRGGRGGDMRTGHFDMRGGHGDWRGGRGDLMRDGRGRGTWQPRYSGQQRGAWNGQNRQGGYQNGRGGWRPPREQHGVFRDRRIAGAESLRDDRDSRSLMPEEGEMDASEDIEEEQEQEQEQLSASPQQEQGGPIGRRPRGGEYWTSCTPDTFSLLQEAPETPHGDYVAMVRAEQKIMLRGYVYTDAVQGRHCELMQANLREVRQPLLARLLCGLLNSGGGRLFLGLSSGGQVCGVLATQAERDSFNTGVLDVLIYSLSPRPPPYAVRVERHVVLKDEQHVPDGEWNRHVFDIRCTATPGEVYEILPERIRYSRRSDGATVIYEPQVSAEDSILESGVLSLSGSSPLSPQQSPLTSKSPDLSKV